MHALVRVLAATLAFAWASTATAESVYVIDQLLVGVHQDKDPDSAIVKVLPTGTKLEVLERAGELAYIEDPEQVRGWVDVAYLTSDPPARLRVAELEREVAKLQKQLAARPQRTAADAPVPDQARVEALTRENTELKGKLSDARLQAGKLQSEISTLRARVQQTQTPPDVRVAELTRARDELEGRLEDAAERIRRLEARASKEDIVALVPVVLEAYAVPLLIGLGVLFALAFGLGVYVMDLIIRRRHGGFRV